MKDSYDIIAEQVREFWKEESFLPVDVIVFFEQKYEHEKDNEWDCMMELVECNGSNDYESVTFLNDFCEGQTCVRNIKIVPLIDVCEFYRINKIGGVEK